MQKDVNSIIMQQIFTVEFIVGNQQCIDCQKSFTEHTWVSVIQVRQHRKHKRTMFMLEQLLIKHGVCADVMQIKEVADGLDFYWGNKSSANKMVEFLRSVLPIRINQGKKLISQDDNSNVRKYKFSTYVEIAPTSKDDLIVLSNKLTAAVGGVSPLMLCHRVSNTVHLVDPISLKTTELSSERYFLDPPRVVLTSEQLVEFEVLDIEHAEDEYIRSGGDKDKMREGLTQFNKHNKYNSKLHLAEVTVARSNDFDRQFVVTTHLGHMLYPGCTVLGYDISKHNITEDVSAVMRGRDLPDVVLVRRTYPERKKRAERRYWKLRQLAKASADKIPKKFEQERHDQEMERFLQDIEEDPELRSKFNLYSKYETEEEMKAMEARLAEDAGGEDLDDGFPEIKMDELVNSLQQVNLEGEHEGGFGGGDADDDEYNGAAGGGDDDDDEAEEADTYPLPASAAKQQQQQAASAGPAGGNVRSGRFLKNAKAPAKQGGFAEEDYVERE